MVAAPLGARPIEELYDLATDPEEWHNLAGRSEHAAVQAKLRSAGLDVGDR